MWAGSLVLYLMVFLISIYAAQKYEISLDKGQQSTAKSRHTRRKLAKINPRKLFWKAVSVSPLILLATFRDTNVGWDYENYIGIYALIKEFSPQEYWQLHFFIAPQYYRYEIGFQFINSLVYHVFDSHIFLAFVCESIIVFFIWNGIEYYHKRYNISIAMMLWYFFMLDYLQGYNTIRFSMGIAITFWAFKFVDQRRFILYLISILLAASVHKISFLYLFFYFFNVLNFRIIRAYAKWIILLGVGISTIQMDNILAFVRSFHLFAYTSKYAMQENDYKVLATIVRSVIMFIPLLCYWKDIRKIDKNLLPFIATGLLYLPVCILGYYNFFFTRLGRFPLLIFFLVICVMINEMGNRNNAIILRNYYLAFAAVNHIFVFIIRGATGAYPYVLISFGL